MDSRHSSSGSRARAPRITNGDMLADRARALVDRTRAGLGVKGVMVKRSAGLGAEGLGVLPDNLPVYDFDFIKELEQIRSEHISQAHSLTVGFKQRELTIVMDGVSRLLDSVGVMDPNMGSKVAQCQKLLNEILSGTSFEDASSNGSEDEWGEYSEARTLIDPDGDTDEDGFKREPEFQSNAKRVVRYKPPADPVDWDAVNRAKRPPTDFYQRDRKSTKGPVQQ